MKKGREHTTTFLVEMFLRRTKDYHTAPAIVKGLEGMSNTNRVTSALHELRYYHVVDCEKVEGQLWWYALPEDRDTRSKVLHERVMEVVPRKPRKKKATKI